MRHHFMDAEPSPFFHAVPVLATILTTALWVPAAGCGNRNVGGQRTDGGGRPEAGNGPVCGDGFAEGDEVCDGLDFRGHTCLSALGYTHGTLRCTPECLVDSSNCHTCGNQVIEGPEQCDGPDLAGQTCATVTGHVDGDLGCTPGCLFDTSGCHTCGNGIVEGDEECDDGNTLPGDGCGPDCRFGFICGDGLCESNAYETCQLCPLDCCPHCGNGVREVQYGELCDINDLAWMTCLDFCYNGGALACNPWCEFDFSNCTGPGPICGDNVAECTEDCDNTDLRGMGCADLGYAQGQLGCSANCQFDVSGCSGLIWYLHEDFEGPSVADWTFNVDWQVGTPYQSSPPEPQTAHSGQNCAGTVVGGIYSNNDRYDTCTLISPEVNLATATSPVLSFYQYVHTEMSWDGGNVWVSTDGGINWFFLDNSLIEPDYYDNSVGIMWAYSGDHTAEGWHNVLADLSSFAGQTIRIRFAFYTDSSVNSYAGWYIDDVVITEP